MVSGESAIPAFGLRVKLPPLLKRRRIRRSLGGGGRLWTLDFGQVMQQANELFATLQPPLAYIEVQAVGYKRGSHLFIGGEEYEL